MNTQKQRKLLFKNSIKFIAIFIIILSSFNSNAFENKLYTQKDTIINSKINNYIFPKNIIFFEVKGVTNYYSFNYERNLLSIKNNNFSIRVGMCIIPIQGYAYIFPITINYKAFLSKKIIVNIGFTYNNFFDNKYYYNYALELGVLYKFYKSMHIRFTGLKYFNYYQSYGFGVSLGFDF